MKPNPNLWAVDIADRNTGAVHISLWVCAASATSAESKAKQHAKKMGLRRVYVSRVAHQGEVDVF